MLVPFEAGSDNLLTLLSHEVSQSNDELDKLGVEKVSVLNVGDLDLQ